MANLHLLQPKSKKNYKLIKTYKHRDSTQDYQHHYTNQKWTSSTQELEKSSIYKLTRKACKMA